MDDGDSESDAGNTIQERGIGCFPVASLDDDFDGEPTNGAEYLAMIQREAARLPFTTKVDAPGVRLSAVGGIGARDFELPSTSARHPALPKESWYVAFDGHFKSYRKFIRDSRSALQARYKETIAQPSKGRRPLPNGHSETEWLAFINGAKRKKMHKSTIKNANSTTSGSLTAHLAEDEEEQMNNSLLNPAEAASETAPGQKLAMVDDADPESSYILEVQQPKHLPQEPHLPMLSVFDQETIYVALRSLNQQIFTKIRQIDGPNLLMETQPGSHDEVSSTPITLPLSAHQARWIFSILLFLDDYLPPDDLADLRNIAKTCLRIVRWQVTSKTHLTTEGQASQSEQEDMRTSCWIIHRAISVGWAQNDLPRDAESIFGRLQQQARVST